MTAPKFYALHDPSSPQQLGLIAQELSSALMSPKPEISPKYLYDALGSALFDAITELPEYYPTRTESQIFRDALPEMAAQLPRRAALIDLGAGSCEKAARLFEAFEIAHYIPIDISVDYLRKTLECLQREHPQIRMTGVGMDFSNKLELPPELMQEIVGLPIIVFYPGSSIGNFHPSAARELLAQANALCRQGAPGGGLLIGVDLVKSKDLLEAAYDDALGVTASFNLNMLLNINRLLGCNFNVRDWQHRSLFNTQESRIEMHLLAKHEHTVRWQQGAQSFERYFKAGDDLHTENSYKWTIPRFAALLESADFARPRSWADSNHAFSLHWANASA